MKNPTPMAHDASSTCMTCYKFVINEFTSRITSRKVNKTLCTGDGFATYGGALAAAAHARAYYTIDGDIIITERPLTQKELEARFRARDREEAQRFMHGTRTRPM
jgi:hypothetical protein